MTMTMVSTSNFNPRKAEIEMFLTDEELADLTHRRRRPETRANKGFPRLPYWFDPSTAHQEKTSRRDFLM